MSESGVKTKAGGSEGGGDVKYPEVEILRIRKAFWLAIVGLLLAAVLVIVLLSFGIKTSTDIVAIVGLFTSVLGTLVGAFFGLQIGSAGKEKADERADKAEQTTQAVLSVVSPEQVEKARMLFPKSFK